MARGKRGRQDPRQVRRRLQFFPLPIAADLGKEKPLAEAALAEKQRQATSHFESSLGTSTRCLRGGTAKGCHPGEKERQENGTFWILSDVERELGEEKKRGDLI